VSTDAFLRTVVQLLREAEISFMLCGSVCSSYWGEPRATFDFDLVVDPTEETLDRLLKSIPDEFYVSAEAARVALRDRGMFNVLDPSTGGKADLIIRKNRAFSREEFSRRHSVTLLDVSMPIASPEDAIISKLEWGQMGSSERQINDAAGIISVQPPLDDAYLDLWARELGVTNELGRARREAGD